MLLNGLFRGALMLTAGVLFSWVVATAFETRAVMNAAASARTSDLAALHLAPAKLGGVRALF